MIMCLHETSCSRVKSFLQPTLGCQLTVDATCEWHLEEKGVFMDGMDNCLGSTYASMSLVFRREDKQTRKLKVFTVTCFEMTHDDCY